MMSLNPSPVRSRAGPTSPIPAGRAHPSPAPPYVPALPAAASFREDLVVQMDAAHPCLFENPDRAGRVVGLAVAGVRVGDNREGGGARDVRAMGFRFAERHQPDIGQTTDAVREHGPRDVDRVEAHRLDQARTQRVDRTGHGHTAIFQ